MHGGELFPPPASSLRPCVARCKLDFARHSREISLMILLPRLPRVRRRRRVEVSRKIRSIRIQRNSAARALSYRGSHTPTVCVFCYIPPSPLTSSPQIFRHNLFQFNLFRLCERPDASPLANFQLLLGRRRVSIVNRGGEGGNFSPQSLKNLYIFVRNWCSLR